eukprot:3773646-Amphidinium_carterae.1
MERIDAQLLSHLEKANVTEGCLARIFHQMLRALAHLHNISVEPSDVHISPVEDLHSKFSNGSGSSLATGRANQNLT